VGGDDGAVIDRYLRGITLLASDAHGYYLFNAHGDVVQLADGSGAVTKDYDYDAFGVQVDPDGQMQYTDVGDALFEDTDTNPWRYCGEYFDTETSTIYLRARYYNPALGRFLAEDTHWNIDNMVYGDNPVKWNERRSDEKDPLGLNEYTYKADWAAIMQSGNLYAYALSNPTTYADPSGELALFVAVTVTVFTAYYGALACYNSTKMGMSGWDARLYILQHQISGGLYGTVFGLLLAPAAGAYSVVNIPATMAGGTGAAAATKLSGSAINYAVSSMSRLQHAFKHAADLGFGNWSNQVSQQWRSFVIDNLSRYSQTFQNVLGQDPVTGYYRFVNGMHTATYIYNSGANKGLVATVVRLSVEQLKKFGLGGY